MKVETKHNQLVIKLEEAEYRLSEVGDCLEINLFNPTMDNLSVIPQAGNVIRLKPETRG